MPIYEYKCRTCETLLEVIQKFSDDPLKIHEGCGGELERLIGSPALQFKGSGWYVNDYAKSGKSPSKSGGKSSDSGSGDSSSGDSKSESKSDSKGDSKGSSSPAPASSTKSE